MSAEKQVIFICSGNICRSPMAEALLASTSSTRELSFTASSAGTLGIKDHVANPDATRALAEVDIDLRRHLSRGITDELLESAFAIIVMAPEHEDYLLNRHQDTAGVIVRLWEFCPDGRSAGEIEDPLGCGLDEFRRIRDLTREALGNWLTTLEDS